MLNHHHGVTHTSPPHIAEIFEAPNFRRTLAVKKVPSPIVKKTIQAKTVHTEKNFNKIKGNGDKMPPAVTKTGKPE